MAKNKKKAKPKCIVCQAGRGDHLCPKCKASHAAMVRTLTLPPTQNDHLRWAARRASLLLRKEATTLRHGLEDMGVQLAELNDRLDAIEKDQPIFLKELLPSLAWAPHSAYHSSEVKRILGILHPGVDFTTELEAFEKICLQPAQEGSPKQPVKQPPMTLAEAYALLRECEPAMLAELAKEKADSSDNEEVLAVMADGLVSVSFRVAQRAFDAGCMVKQFRGPGVGYTLAETRPVEGKDYAILGTQAQRILDSIPDTVEEST